MRGGGRSFPRGGHSGDRDYGGKFRGNGNSYRDNGRFNNQSRGNDRRFDDNFGKSGSSNRSRPRYDRRSPERFAHGHVDRSNRVFFNAIESLANLTTKTMWLINMDSISG